MRVFLKYKLITEKNIEYNQECEISRETENLLAVFKFALVKDRNCI